MIENKSGDQGEYKAVGDCMYISRTTWNSQGFQVPAGLYCESKDWLGNSQNSMATWTAQWVSYSLGSYSQFKGGLDQKDLMTKLGCTVRKMLGLGTLGNPLSDLAMQKSYGIMLRHQNQDKTPTSRNPFHYWYSSDTGSPMLWQVNYLDSSKLLLHWHHFFYDLKTDSCSSAFPKFQGSWTN
jgi:hypothetical protein